MNPYIIVAALLPAAVLIYCIYRRDEDKPEPVGQLLKGVGWGILSVVLAVIVVNLIPEFDTGGNPSIVDCIYKAFCVAAIPEELLKAACLYWFLRANKYFDEHMDGIVYAVCVGMGFAGLENIGYLIGAEDWMTLGMTRGLMAVPAHFAFGVIMGYYFSLWRIKGENGAFIKMLLYPILAHGIYDTLVFSLQLSDEVSVFVMLLLFFFLHKTRKHCSKLIAAHLQEDKGNGITTRVV